MQVKCCKMLHARVLCVCLTSACPGHSIAVLSGVLAEVGLKFAQSAQHCTAVQIRTNGTGDAVGLLVSKGAEDLQNVSVPSLYKASSRFCEDLDETREMLTAEHGILAWKAGIAVLCRRCACWNDPGHGGQCHSKPILPRVSYVHCQARLTRRLGASNVTSHKSPEPCDWSRLECAVTTARSATLAWQWLRGPGSQRAKEDCRLVWRRL